jgi:hypothetical protein
MKKFIGFILNIVATICMLVFAPIGLPTSVLFTWWNRSLPYAIARLNEQYTSLAVCKDVLLGIALAPLLNKILITKDSIYKFGIFPQTISYVIGINHINGSITKFGVFWFNFLNRVDSNHCKNAVIRYNKKYNKV